MTAAPQAIPPPSDSFPLAEGELDFSALTWDQFPDIPELQLLQHPLDPLFDADMAQMFGTQSPVGTFSTPARSSASPVEDVSAVNAHPMPVDLGRPLPSGATRTSKGGIFFHR